MEKENAIKILSKVYELEKKLTADDLFFSTTKMICDKPEFVFWSEECKDLLSSFEQTKLICDTLNLLEDFNGWDNEQNFIRLKAKISLIIDKLEDTFTSNEKVVFEKKYYGPFADYLNKAELAHSVGLGAGAVIYLRKVFEAVIKQVADDEGDIEYKKRDNGNPKNMKDLLEKVNERCSIIPVEFSTDKYRLYQELSGIIHGELNEKEGLEKYIPLRRLVVGVLDNVRNKEEFRAAKDALGWIDEGEDE